MKRKVLDIVFQPYVLIEAPTYVFNYFNIQISSRKHRDPSMYKNVFPHLFSNKRFILLVCDCPTDIDVPYIKPYKGDVER